jgi:hypothetical protein
LLIIAPLSRFSSLTFEDPNERLGVSERVVDWMMIVLRPSQPFPLLSAPKITDQSGVEVGNAPARMPERVLPEVAPEVEIDPLEVVRRVVRNEHHRSTVPKGVDEPVALVDDADV